MPLTIELISSGVKVFKVPLFSTRIFGLPDSLMTWKGQFFWFDCTDGSSNFLSISLLGSKIVLLGFNVAWFFAESPLNQAFSFREGKITGLITGSCAIAFVVGNYLYFVYFTIG